MTALDGAAALACPHCGERYFLGADGNVGWLVPPKLYPEEGVSPAKRWLREQGRRVTRLGEPRGVLVPLYWIRGLLFIWERRPVPGWGPSASGPAPGSILGGSWRGILHSGLGAEPAGAGPERGPDGLETHGSVRAYAGAIPGHPLGRLWRSQTVRFAVQPLELLDPDELPAGYGLLAPALSPEQAEEKAARWVARRRRSARLGAAPRRAAGELQRRLNLVAAPLVLVPFAFHDEEGAVVVDGLSGRVRDVVTGAEASAGEEEEAASAFSRLGGPTLLPLECSECGWELTLRERDRLHPCPGCGRCWELVGSKRRRVRQWFLDAHPGRDGRWLPFWVFPRDGGEGEPAGDTGSAEGPPARPLYVPAYSGRHLENQMLLAARLTDDPPRGTWLPEVEESPGGAEVGSAEARGWRFAVEGALARRSPAEFARFLDERHREQHDRETGGPPAGLVWLAFRRERGDLVETATGARVRAEGTLPWEPRRAA